MELRDRPTSSRGADSIQLFLLATCAALVILGTTVPAWAALGGDASSIQSDQVHMQGSRRMIAAQSYTVHEIHAATGTVVREYAAADGKVFAVAWHGPWMPDMRQLLGSYFEQYRAAVQSQSGARMGRRPIMIDEPGLVVQIGGRIRALAGRAYVPQMLPSGVRIEDIQ